MKKLASLSALLFLVSLTIFADTPPPNTVKAKVYSGDGATAVTTTGTSLNVNVTNSSGSSTVNQGTGGMSPWLFTSTQLPVSLGAKLGTGSLSFVPATDASFPVTGTFWQTTQPVSGTFWQATQPVSLTSLPPLATSSNTIGAVNINGTVPVSGTITTTNSANGNTGSSVPAQATQVAGSDGTSLRALSVSSTGVLAVDGSASIQPISAASLPLPALASTAALQTTGNAALGSILLDLTNGTQITQLTGTVPLPTGASTSVLQSTINTTLGTPFQAGGSIGNTSFGATQATAANLNATVVGTAGAALATSALQTTISGQLPTTLGNKAQASSLSVVPANALTLTTSTFNSTTGAINAEMLTGTTNGWYDAAAFNQMAFTTYTVGTVSGGVISFFTTDDPTNAPGGVSLLVQDEATQSQSNGIATLTLTSNNIRYFRAPISKRYVQVKFTTALTGGGTVGLTATFKQTPYAPYQTGVFNNAAAQLLVSVGAFSTGFQINLTGPTINVDQASGTIVTTTTSANVGQALGACNVVAVSVTAATANMDVEVQESADNGLTFFPVYDFPRIVATTGTITSPPIKAMGGLRRYVQTLSGSSPSFTRQIFRDFQSGTCDIFRQIFDRTITLTSLASTTASMRGDGARNVTLTCNIGATTIAPALQIQGSDDSGATFYSIGTPLACVGSSSVSLTVPSVSSQFYRAIVTTAGTVTTAGYVMLRAF